MIWVGILSLLRVYKLFKYVSICHVNRKFISVVHYGSLFLGPSLILYIWFLHFFWKHFFVFFNNIWNCSFALDWVCCMITCKSKIYLKNHFFVWNAADWKLTWTICCREDLIVWFCYGFLGGESVVLTLLNFPYFLHWFSLLRTFEPICIVWTLTRTSFENLPT